MAAIVSAAVSRSKGARPATISYRTQPSENTSLRPSATAPRACSGDMYPTVPSTVPGVVRCSAVGAVSSSGDAKGSARARPKSSTFTRPSVGQEDVVGLQVAVDDALRVRRGQALRDGRADLGRPAPLQDAAPRAALRSVSPSSSSATTQYWSPSVTKS